MRIGAVKYNFNKPKISDAQEKNTCHASSPFILQNIAQHYTYNISFLGRQNYTENDKAFLEYKKQLTKREHQVNIETRTADWNYSTNSNQKNKQLNDAAYQSHLDFYSDKEIRKKLLKFKKAGISDPKLKLDLKELLDTFSGEKESITKLNTEIDSMEKAISKKIDDHTPEIDGKKYTIYELSDMLEKETDPKKRKKIYYAYKVTNSNDMAPEIIKLVNKRNLLAKAHGYSDYFSYAMERVYGMDEKFIFRMLNYAFFQTNNLYSKIRGQEDIQLAKTFGIKPANLKPWHYDLRLGENPLTEVNKKLPNIKTVKSIAIGMLRSMGWDINNSPITLDLLSRKNKIKSCYCTSVDSNKDVRILANLKKNIDSIEYLAHELGHAVYGVGISDKIAYSKREDAYVPSEAIALLMEKLLYHDGFLAKKLNLPKETVEKLKIEKLKIDLNFTRKMLLYITFEKQMYANPNQDLSKLWHSLIKKYLFKNPPPELNNEWTNIEHFLNYPAYLPNYFKAGMMLAQIHETAEKKLGNLTQNKNTAEFFRTKLFRFGKSIDEDELVRRFCGKHLSVNAFCDQFKDLAKHLR